MRRLLSVAMVLILTACASQPSPEQAAEGCYARLAKRQVLYERLAEMKGENGCPVQAAVRMRQGGVTWARPGVVSCPFAETLTDFETAVVQPLAMEMFGQPVRRLHHLGTYNCRKRNGGLTGRTSEHGFGRAIDIRGFELADGTVIDVERHWSGRDRKAQFLQAVARRACARFAVVLTPNHDRLHHDHLHLDGGAYRLCGL